MENKKFEHNEFTLDNYYENKYQKEKTETNTMLREIILDESNRKRIPNFDEIKAILNNDKSHVIFDELIELASKTSKVRNRFISNFDIFTFVVVKVIKLSIDNKDNLEILPKVFNKIFRESKSVSLGPIIISASIFYNEEDFERNFNPNAVSDYKEYLKKLGKKNNV